MIKKISVDNVDIYYEEDVTDSNVTIDCSSDDDTEWINVSMNEDDLEDINELNN